MNNSKRVVVAMSGGVDSSVAAALLIRQGYQVIGMMLRLWNEPDAEATNRCCSPDAMAQARRVAAILGIPFFVVDAQQFFYDQVVAGSFLDGYLRGVTPNPCLVCNQNVRWGFLLQRALAIEADYLATGHYARLRQDDQGRFQLLRAVDLKKDQSYVLHILRQEQLAHTLFPLGEYTKSEVREFARQFGLPVAERPESQDLCFLGGSTMRSFLRRHAPQAEQAGPILTREGQRLGTHSGLSFYTIGQRKGLGISSPVPLYVLEKDRSRNALIVGPAHELGAREMVVTKIHWISGEAPAQPFHAQIKIRHQANLVGGTVTPLDHENSRVLFDAAVRDITPGQAAVFYDGEIVYGGGIIS